MGGAMPEKMAVSKWENVLQYLGLPVAEIKSEAIVGRHIPEERAHLYHSLTSSGSEIETIHMLHSLVLLFKPEFVLETGTDAGFGTLAMASAVAKNGQGRIVTLENDEPKHSRAAELFRASGFSEYITSVLADSLDYINQLKHGVSFGIVYFDSRSHLRVPEFEALWSRGALENLAVFHDTSKNRVVTQPHKNPERLKAYLEGLDKISKEYCRGEIVMPYSRGMRIMQVKPKIHFRLL